MNTAKCKQKMHNPIFNIPVDWFCINLENNHRKCFKKNYQLLRFLFEQMFCYNTARSGWIAWMCMNENTLEMKRRL